MNPLEPAWNRNPRFTGLVSAESTAPVGEPFCHTLHGHVTAAAAVVKLHTNGLLIATPELFCAPDTVAVYVVLAANAAAGVNVATVFPVLKPTDPATDAPPASFSVNDAELGTTACENVAAGATDTATPVAPAAGVTLDTVGGIGGAVWL
jgi:hypothetical protein